VLEEDIAPWNYNKPVWNWR